jgi:hypothetical protein
MRMTNLSGFPLSQSAAGDDRPGVTTRRRCRHRLAAGIAATLLAGGLIAGSAATAAAAALPDPERYSVTPTGWGYYFTADELTINTWAMQNNMRIVDVEVISPTVFTVVMVHNAGIYQRGLTAAASWTTNETSSSLLAKLSGKRLLDLERYLVNGQTRFAAAMVDNPGSNWHDYKWYLSGTIGYITDRIDAFNGRIIDIDRVSDGRYDVVMVKNEGVDAKAWWWYPARTPEEISQLLKDNNARLVDIEPDGVGTYTVVMVASKGEYWLWYPALTAQQVVDMQAQSGMRLVHLKRYTTVFNLVRYVAIFVDTLDPVSVKARQALWPAAGSAAFGFYLKRVDGPVYNALQPDKKFEPASMLKALHHIHAMRAIRNGWGATLGDFITWYKHPAFPNDGGVCPYADDGTKLFSMPQTSTLESILQGMMEQSDNRKTDAVYNRFGPGAINATADWLGMTKTQLNHRIGCTWAAAGQVAAPNELTLADDGRLFEAVYRATNPVLGTGLYRNKFTDLMATGLGTFQQVVTQTAAALGKPPEVASAFYAAMKGAYKPGGYANAAPGASCDSTGCTALLMRNTGGGWISLPVKQGHSTVYRDFVYGVFIDGVFDCGPGTSKDCSQEGDALSPAKAKAFQEMLRPHIKAALTNW